MRKYGVARMDTVEALSPLTSMVSHAKNDDLSKMARIAHRLAANPAIARPDSGPCATEMV